MDVLVTDGDQRSTLAVTRSLGRHGRSVVVGEQRSESLAACSKYCADEFVYPSPVSAPRRFQAAIAARVRDSGYKLLIPMTDITCTLIADIRDDLDRFVTVALPAKSAFEQASDKGQLIRIPTRAS